MYKTAKIYLLQDKGVIEVSNGIHWELPYGKKTKAEVVALITGLGYEIHGISSFEIIEETVTIH